MSGFQIQPLGVEGDRTSIFRPGMEGSVLISTPVGMVDSQRNLDYERAVDIEAGSTGCEAETVFEAGSRRSQRNRRPPDYFVNKELTLLKIIKFRVGMHWFDYLIDECLIVLNYELIAYVLIKILVVFEYFLSNKAILSENLNINHFFIKKEFLSESKVLNDEIWI